MTKFIKAIDKELNNKVPDGIQDNIVSQVYGVKSTTANTVVRRRPLWTILTTAVALIIVAVIMITVILPNINITDTDNRKPSFASINDIYTFSAFTSGLYLSQQIDFAQSLSRKSSMVAKDKQRPIGLAEDIDVLNKYVKVFESVITSGNISYTMGSTNVEEDGQYAQYQYKVQGNTISLDGKQVAMIMYYSFVEENIPSDNDDDSAQLKDSHDNDEQETNIIGVVIIDSIEYTVYGERTVEIDDNETEIETEFTTVYSEGNYVTITQEIENDEISFEYNIYQDNQLIESVSIEWEEEDKQQILTVQLNETKYKVALKKSKKKNYFQITAKKPHSGGTEVFTIESTEGGYRYEYSNGFSEVLT